MAITALVNTRNEEKNIERCLQSLTWADEILVFDAQSTDKTRELAQKYTSKVLTHNDPSGYVETQRNAGIEKASNEWILVVDADEEVPPTLAQKLKALSEEQRDVSFYEIPRKNLIFNKWFTGSGWWPDYNIRFFKKGSVTWTEKIHVPPQTQGRGETLEAKESLALIHHHYESVSQYLLRLDRYTTVQAKEVVNGGYTFSWPDLLRKPLSEFLTRFFVWEGYKDGVHGLVLSLLQAFSFFIVYIKVWEVKGFVEVNTDTFLQDMQKEGQFMQHELNHWYKEKSGGKGSILKKLFF